MFLLLSLIIFVLLLAFVYYQIKIRNSPLVAAIPDALPTFSYGLSKKDMFNKVIYMGDYCNKHNGAGKFNVGPVFVYVISNPEDATTVLNQCMEKVFVYKLINSYVGEELISASVPVWKKNRKLVDNAFKQNIMDLNLKTFNKQSKRLVNSLATEVNKSTDLSGIVTRIVLETVCQSIMGLKTQDKAIVNDEYAAAVQTMLTILTDRFQYPWLILDFIFNFSNLKKKQDEALKVIWSLSDEMVALKKKEYEKSLLNIEADDNVEKVRSFLDIMIEHTHKGNEYTDIQLRNLVDNMMLAAYDTSTYEILIALICIGTYPEIQDKMYQEIHNIWGGHERDFTKEDLSSLTYLDAVVKEVLRLYPIGPVVARQSERKVQLKNFELPSGVPVIVHVWSINRNPEVWGSDADVFKPERWLDPSSLPPNPAAFASFSPGRRNCVGKPYAMMIIKTMVAHVVYNYKIKSDHTKLQFELVVLLKPFAGHLIELETRDKFKCK